MSENNLSSVKKKELVANRNLYNEQVESSQTRGVMRPDLMYSENPEDPEYDMEEGGAYYEMGDNDPDEQPRPMKKDSISLFRLMINLLISPKNGWKEIRRRHLTSDEVCLRLFYPLIGLASISNFINLWYYPDISLTKEIIYGIVTFSSFFFSFFLISVIGKLVLKGKGAEAITTNFGKIFSAFALSTLCLFFILYTALPMLEPIMVMLPLWTIFVITRGIKFLRIPETDQTSATVWLSILIIGLPIGVGYIFDILLGNQ